jgi:3-oxoacyl-[acyl-carrier-protein] synthase III
MTAPVALDYIDRIAREAGIPDSAIKVAVHKACDGSVGSLHLSLNPTLPEAMHLPINLAQELYGKKVLIGGIEGLSRLLGPAHDIQALQLFGNGAGVIGIIPGQNMKFLAGATREAYDEEGALQVAMAYPHARERVQGRSMLEVTQIAPNQLRVAGLMHEPATTEGNREPVVMAGPMGMVKLFVRTGVITVREAYHAYLKRMAELGTPDKPIKVVIAHHANYKINLLKGKQLEKEGISLSIPWLISDFGNVSAASTMICFLRKLPELQRGDNILFDGFGAGTYYDVVAVELGA